ncbi:hypothetical protein G7054_g1754 [Neopestalotiopsis clavispora]|nr:hypothetical protein G7054_g1754 [Neopestalotiopsis clavispora]
MAEQHTPQHTPKEVAGDKDARFFFAVLKHLKTKPDTDWDAVAAELGYANKAVAQTRFGQIKRRLGITGGDKTPEAKNKVTKSTPKKTGSAKAKQNSKVVQLDPEIADILSKLREEKAQKKEEENDDDAETIVPGTPTPAYKTLRINVPARVIKNEEDEEDGDDEV